MGRMTREYQAQYRAENPDYVNRQAKRATARREALRMLAEKHPHEFEALFQERLKHYGVLSDGGAS